MADIFGGVEIPRWLQEASSRNAEHGQWGKLAGTLAAGLFNSQQREPTGQVDAESGNPETQKKGFAQGLFEARMNQQDPLWKLKAAQAQAQTAGHIASAQAAYALANERKTELADWAADAPNIVPWLAMPREKRAVTPAPVVKSQKAASLIEQRTVADGREEYQSQYNTIREANTKLALDNQQRSVEWDAAKSTAPAELQAQIAELPNQGWIVDGQGKRISPSTQALGLLNPWRLSQGLAPFGASKGDVTSQQQAEKQRLMSDRQKKNLEEKYQFAEKLLTLKSDKEMEKQRVHDQTMKDIAAAKGNTNYSWMDRQAIAGVEKTLDYINKKRIDLESSTLSNTEKNKARLSLWSEEHNALEQLQAAIELAEKHAAANRSTPTVPAAAAPSAGQGVPSTQLQSRDMLPGDDAPHVTPTPLGTTPNPTRYRWEKGVLIPLP